MSGQIVVRVEHFPAMVARERFGRGRRVFGRRRGPDGLDRGLDERGRRVGSRLWQRGSFGSVYPARLLSGDDGGSSNGGVSLVVEHLRWRQSRRDGGDRGRFRGTAAVGRRFGPGPERRGHVLLERRLERVEIVDGRPRPHVRFHDPGDGKRQRARRLGRVLFPVTVRGRVPLVVRYRPGHRLLLLLLLFHNGRPSAVRRTAIGVDDRL